jgi:hypothetical protein
MTYQLDSQMRSVSFDRDYGICTVDTLHEVRSFKQLILTSLYRLETCNMVTSITVTAAAQGKNNLQNANHSTDK